MQIASKTGLLKATVSVVALLFGASAALAQESTSSCDDTCDQAAIDVLADDAGNWSGDVEQVGNDGTIPDVDETLIDVAPVGDDLGDDLGDDPEIVIDDPSLPDDGGPWLDPTDPDFGGGEVAVDPADPNNDGGSTDGSDYEGHPEIAYMSAGSLDPRQAENQRHLTAPAPTSSVMQDHVSTRLPDQCSFGGPGLAGLCVGAGH